LTPHVPLTEDQWHFLRAQMEAVAGGHLDRRSTVNPVELAEMILILMDRIDQLEKEIHEVRGAS
jgi:hypothetical protein